MYIYTNGCSHVYIYIYVYIIAALPSLKERVSPPALEERGGASSLEGREDLYVYIYTYSLPTTKGGPLPLLEGRGDSPSLPLR